jgi:hypothetical protein
MNNYISWITAPIIVRRSRFSNSQGVSALASLPFLWEFFSLNLRIPLSLPETLLTNMRGYISQVCKRERYGWLPDCHDLSMPHKKSKTQSDDATRVSVTNEMAMPRMTRSAKIAELNLDTSRIPERPSTTMPGIVNKIIPSPQTSQPEKAQIAVEGTDQRYRNLRIDNTLTDEHGDDVKLKKGAHVDVIVTAKADRN